MRSWLGTGMHSKRRQEIEDQHIGPGHEIQTCDMCAVLDELYKVEAQSANRINELRDGLVEVTAVARDLYAYTEGLGHPASPSYPERVELVARNVIR